MDNNSIQLLNDEIDKNIENGISSEAASEIAKKHNVTAEEVISLLRYAKGLDQKLLNSNGNDFSEDVLIPHTQLEIEYFVNSLETFTYEAFGCSYISEYDSFEKAKFLEKISREARGNLFSRGQLAKITNALRETSGYLNSCLDDVYASGYEDHPTIDLVNDIRPIIEMAGLNLRMASELKYKLDKATKDKPCPKPQ